MEFLILILASIGMAQIMVDGSIFNSFRNWLGKENNYIFPFKWLRKKMHELSGCYLCSGTWAGMISGLILWVCGRDPLGLEPRWVNAPILFLYGCVGGYVSMQAAVIMLWMQTKIGDE